MQHQGSNLYSLISESPPPHSCHLRSLSLKEESEKLEQQLQHLASTASSAEQSQDALFLSKMLMLREKQKQIRSDVLSDYHKGKVALYEHQVQTEGDRLYQRQLVDREFYKRARLSNQSKKEQRTLDRFEKQMRSGQELRKKTRHREFLTEILQHTKEFHEFHKKKSILVKRKAQIVKNFFESKEKKKDQQEAIKERESLKNLKSMDFDKWLEEVTLHKNSRLLEILNSTDKYLEQLGAKVQMQKEDKMSQEMKGRLAIENAKKQEEEQAAKEEADKEEQADMAGLTEQETIKMKLKNSSKVYYNITHTI